MKSELHENYQKYNFNKSLKLLNQTDAKGIYEFMLRLRMVEESIIDEYHPADQMKCPIHFCIGQEAVSAIINNIIHTDDYLFSHHRSHGYYLAKGCSLNELISELYGKKTGANMGLAGSQDISSSKNNFYAGAILTGAVGIATGVAFSKKINNENSCVVCCFGEGATDQGIFWEAVNYAALKKLPILFICENNIYATYSHMNKRMANKDICEKVSAFGVTTKRIFGNDVIELYNYLKNIREKLNDGPIFLEAITYRISSHVGPEDDSYIYRNQEEVDQWKRLCPIKNFEQLIFDKYEINKNKIENQIQKEILLAFENAKNAEYLSVNDWNSLNYSNKSNDKIKKIENTSDFSIHNNDTIPGPY